MLYISRTGKISPLCQEGSRRAHHSWPNFLAIAGKEFLADLFPTLLEKGWMYSEVTAELFAVVGPLFSFFFFFHFHTPFTPTFEARARLRLNGFLEAPYHDPR